MGALQQRRVMTVLPVVAILTILSGARLMWLTSAGMAPGYLSSRTGLTLVIGAVAGIVAFLVGMFVGRPTAMRSGQLAGAIARATDGAEKAALASELDAVRRRGATASTIVMVLLVVAAGTMAIARYLS
jgi:hypothetical protein